MLHQKYDLIVIGHIGYDHKSFWEGKKRVDVGGAGLYVSLGASFFSDKIGLISKIGIDFESAILGDLGEAFDIRGVKRSNGKTSRFYNNYDKNHNSINFKAEFGVGADICFKNAPLDYADAQIYHVATMPPMQQLMVIDELTLIGNKSISIDTNSYYIKKYPGIFKKCLNRAEYLFLNEVEHKLLIDTLKDTTIPCKNLLIKKGDKGVKFIAQNVEYNFQALKAKAIDTCGAGDVFAGAFLASISYYDIKKSLFNALVLASTSVEDFGVLHLKTKTELIKERLIDFEKYI